MTIGKAGGGKEPDYFFAPNDVVVAPNGDIIVAEGHGGDNSRAAPVDKTGKLIKSFGKKGSGKGEFDQPHALAYDSKGRLFVGDRGNNRILIYDDRTSSSSPSGSSSAGRAGYTSTRTTTSTSPIPSRARFARRNAH